MNTIYRAAALAVLALVTIAPVRADGIPEFRADPYWPKPLPNNWLLGQIGGSPIFTGNVDTGKRVQRFERVKQS